MEQAVARLGYHPDHIARGLSTGTIGFLVPDIANPFFSGIVKAAQRRARECGLAVLYGAGPAPPGSTGNGSCRPG